MESDPPRDTERSDGALRYQADVDLSDLNHSRTQLIVLTGSGKRVLEVGPAAGDVTKVLRQHGCRVTGIETDPDAAGVAAQHADRMIVGNLETLDLDRVLQEERFDVILLGDVLEHMVDPQSAVIRLAAFLAPGGYFVASIPNVTHASIRLALLAGRFRYTDEGLLDRTHLRFFDRRAVDELFRRAGCTILEWRRTTAGIFDTDVDVYPDEFPPWLLEAVAAAPEATTFQFVVKAEPTSEESSDRPAEHGPEAVAPFKDLLGRAIDGPRRLRRLVDRVAPRGTRRHSLVRGTLRGLRLLRRHDWRRFLRGLAQPRRWLPGLVEPTVPDTQTLSPEQRYNLWLRARVLSPERMGAKRRALSRFSYLPTISLVLFPEGADQGGTQETVTSVEGQLYPRWELCRTLELATGEFVAFVRAGDELKPNALYEVVRLLNRDPDLDFVYTDEDAKGADGRLRDPFFKPEWSPDLIMSMDYATTLGVFRRDLADKMGGLRPELGPAQVFDLALRIAEVTERIGHCPSPVYSRAESKAEPLQERDGGADPWRLALLEAMARRGYAGTVEPGLVPGRYRARYELSGSPSVTILVPTRDRRDLLEPCVDSIARLSTYGNYEIVVIDNGSRDPETRRYLKRFPGRVVRYPHPFSFARMMNAVVHELPDRGFLLFLNNDTRVIEPEWIEAMLEHAQRQEVGAVGARLLYPDGSPQHEGILVGVGGGAATNVEHAWFGMGQTVRDCSAVTAACMLIRREVFEELGGFDEHLSVAYNDVDLCLRARERGYQIVYTPHALLYHDEGSSRGKGGMQPPEEEEYFLDRWRGYRDPYYRPNFDPVRLFELNWAPLTSNHGPGPGR